MMSTASTTASRRALISLELVELFTLGPPLATRTLITLERLINSLYETRLAQARKRLRDLAFLRLAMPSQRERQQPGRREYGDIASRSAMVRTAGFEPALPNGKRILSPQRLPFRHVRLLAWRR